MKAPKDLTLLTPGCLPCAQPGPPPSHPAEVRRPIKSRRSLQCNVLRHGQAQFSAACDIVATVLVRRDPVLARFPGSVQRTVAAGSSTAKGLGTRRARRHWQGAGVARMRQENPGRARPCRLAGPVSAPDRRAQHRLAPRAMWTSADIPRSKLKFRADFEAAGVKLQSRQTADAYRLWVGGLESAPERPAASV